MNAFLFYVDDWLSSKHIELMDAAEERGYLRLLLRCAKEEDCGIPCDDAQLSIMSMLGAQWWKLTADKTRRIANKTSGEKLRECFELRGDRLYNLRLLKEFENQKRIREERRIAGLKGGRPKANGNQLVSNSLANDNQMGKQTESKTKQALSPKPLEELKTPVVPLPEKRQRQQKVSFDLVEPPADWIAYAVSYGWDRSRIDREFEKLRRWAFKENVKRPGWLKTWEGWVDRAEEKFPTSKTELLPLSFKPRPSIFSKTPEELEAELEAEVQKIYARH